MTLTDGIIALDVPCVNCGYNLRTLAAGAVCPECATAVKVSLESTLARWGAAYLRQLQRAIRGAAWLGVATPCVCGISLAASFFLETVMRYQSTQWIGVFFFSSLLLAGILNAICSWVIARPPPGERLRARQITIRATAMIGIVTLLAPWVGIIVQAIARLRGPMFLIEPWIETLMRICLTIWISLWFSFAVFALAMGGHLASLCQRAGLPTLVGWHRWMGRVTGAGVFAFNVGMMFAVLEEWDWFPVAVSWEEQTRGVLLGGGFLVAAGAFIAELIVLFLTAKGLGRLSGGCAV